MLSCPSDRSHFILHSEVSFSGVGTWFINSRDWVWSWGQRYSSRIGILELRLYSRDWSRDPGLVTSTWNPSTLNAGTRRLLWIWSLVCIVCSRTDLALQWDSISNKADITKLKTAPNLVSSVILPQYLTYCANVLMVFFFFSVLHHPNSSANFFSCIQSW